MALILSIETSSTVCSAALHEKGELLAHREELLPQSAASLLTPLIDSLFLDSGLAKTSIQAVAVSAGPGSYTGLRIGVATGKGICYALGIPLISIDSLYVLAQALQPRHEAVLLCPMIDARRMEVYTCLLTDNFEWVQPTRPLVIDEKSFEDVLNKNKVVFFGSGADKCREILKHPNAIFEGGISPHARFMGKAGHNNFEKATFVDLRTFEPAYLKEFVAKTKKA